MNVTCMTRRPTKTAEGEGLVGLGFTFYGSRWRANARKMATVPIELFLSTRFFSPTT